MQTSQVLPRDPLDSLIDDFFLVEGPPPVLHFELIGHTLAFFEEDKNCVSRLWIGPKIARSPSSSKLQALSKPKKEEGRSLQRIPDPDDEYEELAVGRVSDAYDGVIERTLGFLHCESSLGPSEGQSGEATLNLSDGPAVCAKQVLIDFPRWQGPNSHLIIDQETIQLSEGLIPVLDRIKSHVKDHRAFRRATAFFNQAPRNHIVYSVQMQLTQLGDYSIFPEQRMQEIYHLKGRKVRVIQAGKFPFLSVPEIPEMIRSDEGECFGTFVGTVEVNLDSMAGTLKTRVFLDTDAIERARKR